MKRISLRAAIFGGVADILLSTVIGMVVVAVTWAVAFAAAGSTVSAQTMMDATNSPGSIAALAVMGGLVSVFAGWYSARIAGHDLVLNGAVSAWLCVLFGIFHVVVASESVGRLVIDVLMLPLSPALGAVGGVLRLRQLSRRASRTAT